MPNDSNIIQHVSEEIATVQNALEDMLTVKNAAEDVNTIEDAFGEINKIEDNFENTSTCNSLTNIVKRQKTLIFEMYVNKYNKISVFCQNNPL